MALLFTQLCDLFSALEQISSRDPPLLPDQITHRYTGTLKSWFAAHKISLYSLVAEPVALLSTLFPEKRTDRVYAIQAPRLARSLRDYLCLGHGRWQLLDGWSVAGQGGLGGCVERILAQAEHQERFGKDRVTLEDIDGVLGSIASRCRFSGPKVRVAGQDSDKKTNEELANIYRRLQSREAKWFTRLILKDFSAIELDKYQSLVFACIDARLPMAMQMYHNFEDAIAELKSLPGFQMIALDQNERTRRCSDDSHLLRPKVGVKVGPPKWVKAKGGVKHAVTLCDGKKMTLERKHDGEYCQIHVDLSKGADCVQIFSKSGKDSTQDRFGVHQAIKDGLRIGYNDCKFSDKCILEGELVVWSERTKCILDFHKIRKHVSRSGSFLGTAYDSQPHPWEKLMIIYFDVLLVDEDAVLHKPLMHRRKVLKDLVTRIKGRAELVVQKCITFSKADGPNILKKTLAEAFVRRWEGLVLKPTEESYFSLQNFSKGRYPSPWIKLKKDCIKGLGDTADFAIVGAGYDVKVATKLGLPNIHWTHFYLGCLQNKDAVIHSNARPSFMICDCVSDCISKNELKALNQHGHFVSMSASALEAASFFDLQMLPMDSRFPKIQVLFKKPFVFDIAGSGFDKGPNRDLFTLRFPRVMKIHWDRDWRQTVSLDELQEMARHAMTAPGGNSQEEQREVAIWMQKLTEIDRGTRGQMNSWDYTDDDKCDENEATPKPMLVPKASRNRRTPLAPTLVRMDTAEMTPNERRHQNGEVTERPTSRHSITSTRSENSLPTPPTSSPTKVSDDIWLTKQPRSPINQRKRSESDCPDDWSPRNTKKIRSTHLQHSKSEIKPRNGKPQGTTKGDKTLREIANPPSLNRSTTLPSTKASTSSEPFRLHKQVTGAIRELRPPRRRQRPMLMEPSSPERHTTTDECTSADTTQSSLPVAVPIAEPRPSEPPIQAVPAMVSELPTPPSTAATPVQLPIPNLRKSQILLSSSLTDFRRLDGECQELLLGLPQPTLSLEQVCQSFAAEDGNILNPEKDIIVLVDTAKWSASMDELKKLVCSAAAWHPRTISIFEWRLLDVLIRPWNDVHEKMGAVNEQFVVRILWHGEMVRVEWCDGLVTVVGKEALRVMMAL